MSPGRTAGSTLRSRPGSAHPGRRGQPASTISRFARWPSASMWTTSASVPLRRLISGRDSLPPIQPRGPPAGPPRARGATSCSRSSPRTCRRPPPGDTLTVRALTWPAAGRAWHLGFLASSDLPTALASGCLPGSPSVRRHPSITTIRSGSTTGSPSMGGAGGQPDARQPAAVPAGLRWGPVRIVDRLGIANEYLTFGGGSRPAWSTVSLVALFTSAARCSRRAGIPRRSTWGPSRRRVLRSAAAGNRLSVRASSSGLAAEPLARYAAFLVDEFPSSPPTRRNVLAALDARAPIGPVPRPGSRPNERGSASTSSRRLAAGQALRLGGPRPKDPQVVRPLEGRWVSGSRLADAAAQLGDRAVVVVVEPGAQVGSRPSRRGRARGAGGRGHHRDIGAHDQALTTSAAVDAPRAGSQGNSAPSWGRRMAIQRNGRRISQGRLSSTRGTTSRVSRSRSGW